jgi:AraC-like DNA-binding protein
MTRARLLIERTSLPVSEVMANVRVTDRSHFAQLAASVCGVAVNVIAQDLRNGPRRV